MEQKNQTAINFGISLDNDDFEAAKLLLVENCIYEINDKTLVGNHKIINTYKTNMEEGKLKFDHLEWGKSSIVQLNENEFEVHFSDHLPHQGISHNYKCKQKLVINEENLIEKIIHQEFPGEREKLDAFYKKVNLK